MSRQIRPLRLNHLTVIQLQELGEAVPGGAAARAHAAHQHVRQRRAPRGARAGPARAPRGRAAGPAPRARDEVVRGPSVRPVVQLVY